MERNNDVLRKTFLSPPPEIGADEEAFNATLLQKCAEKLSSDTHYLKMVLKSKLFEEDKKAGLPLPAFRFDERRQLTRHTNNCALVRVRGCWYSTSDKHPHRAVKIMLGAFTLDIYDENDNFICSHKRSYVKGHVDIIQENYADALAARPKATLLKGIQPERYSIIETLSPEQKEEVETLIRDARPAMKLDILEEYLESHGLPDALFELQPYEVSKENYDEIIRQNGDVVQKTPTG